MVKNSSEIVYFVLAAYGHVGELQYLYFSIMLLWFLSICVANTVLITLICVDKTLHEPMYILLCNLFVNEIVGSTSLYPLMLSQMLSATHQVTLPWCFLQMCCIYTSASVELCSLAAMAYDRHMAICYPLHYSAIMNTGRVVMMLLFVWTYSFINVMFLFLFVLHLKFCGNVIDKVFCDHQRLVKLACSVSIVDKISDLPYAFMTIVVPFSFISFSYMKILTVCLNTSAENKQNKQKAVSTCTPQIVSVSNIFVGCIFHIVDSRFDLFHVPDKVRIFLSVYVLICQPMITPFMYGFNLPKIRQSCKRFVVVRK